MIQTLKTWPDYFNAVLSGEKTFEIRKNDRDYKVGDELRLEEYIPDDLQYTGRVIAVTVTYILHGGNFGIEDGYCVMSIERS